MRKLNESQVLCMNAQIEEAIDNYAESKGWAPGQSGVLVLGCNSEEQSLTWYEAISMREEVGLNSLQFGWKVWPVKREGLKIVVSVA